MEMTLTVHLPRRLPRPVDVVVHWTGTHRADDLCRALADHLGEPVPALGSRGHRVGPEVVVGRPPLVHGASVSVLTHRHGSRVPGGAPAGLGAVELAVVGGPDCGRSAAISPPGLDVGRSPDVGLQVHDDSLSRIHATFVATSSGITVEDRGSTNGVVVDGRRVTAATAVDTSSTIVAGGSTLALRRRPGAGLPVRPAGDGRVSIRPTQAPEPRLTPAPVEAPSPPAERRSTRVPWLGALVPIPVAAVLAVLFGPQMLAFALLGPTVMLATALGDRWGSGREHRRALEAHRADTTQARERLAERLRIECVSRRAARPDPHRVLVTAEHRQPGLWQQSVPRPLRIGLGDAPAETTWVEGATTSRPTARLVPVTLDLARAGRFGVVGDTVVTDRLLGALLGQLVVDLPPTCLAVAVASSEASWAWARILPHHGAAPSVPEGDVGRLRCTQVVVVPDAGAVDAAGWAEHLREQVLVIVAAPTGQELPGGCTAVLTQGVGSWVLTSQEGSVSVTPDLVGSWWTDRVARALAPLRVEARPGATSPLPRSVGLPGLLGLSMVSSDTVAARWSGHRTDGNPAPPIAGVGVGPEGTWSIDLRRDGPHLLVGGTTGSGKSEFLRTLVTSLALACPPEDLTFVLVDFKGGSAFGTCTGLPHVVGLVTDLDEQLVDRALRSLGAELRRRERAFAAVGARDLEDFHRRRSPDDDGLPRLVIVIDELRALVDELPDFVSGLVRIAALGRSLGVHLVLATQRPAGVVTAEIQANVNLRIAFRVRDRADSTDVLDHAGAASIPSDAPGRGMARGGDGAVLTFQAATLSHDGAVRPPALWVSAGRLVDPPVVHGDHQAAGTEPGDPARSIVRAVAAAHAERGGEAPRAPWLAPLPDVVPFGPPPADDATNAGPARVALLDQPDQQVITALVAPCESTWLLSGPPGSGRTTAARAVVLALASHTTSADLHVHVIEVGRALRDLDHLDHLGTRLRVDDPGAIRHLVDLLRADVDARLEATRAESPARGWPDVVVVVDGWEQLVEAQPESDHGRTPDDLLRLLRDGGSVGIRAVVTGGRSLLQPRWSAVGADLFLIGRTDPLDAALAGLAPRDALRGPPPGRAIRVSDRQHLQFVLATPDDTASVTPSAAVTPLGRRPLRLRPLPRVVHRSQLLVRDDHRSLVDRGCLLLGVGGRQAEPVWLDPTRLGRRVAVVGPPGSGRTTTLQAVARSCLSAGRTVAVLTPSPEEWAAVPDCLVTSPSAPEAVVELRRRVPALVLLLDDADRLDGSAAEPVVREISELVDRDGGLLLVATAPRSVSTRFRGVDVDVCREQAGVLLCPETGDGEILGVRRLATIPRIPGRGVLVCRGTLTDLQVLAPEPPTGGVGPVAISSLGVGVDLGVVGLEARPRGEGGQRPQHPHDHQQPADAGATGLHQRPADGQEQQVPHDGRGAGPLPGAEPAAGEHAHREGGESDEQCRHHDAPGVAAPSDRQLVEVEHREGGENQRVRTHDEGEGAAGAAQRWDGHAQQPRSPAAADLADSGTGDPRLHVHRVERSTTRPEDAGPVA